jgi:hypothetical protein
MCRELGDTFSNHPNECQNHPNTISIDLDIKVAVKKQLEVLLDILFLITLSSLVLN